MDVFWLPFTLVAGVLALGLGMAAFGTWTRREAVLQAGLAMAGVTALGAAALGWLVLVAWWQV
jgi:hypothetical protein